LEEGLAAKARNLFKFAVTFLWVVRILDCDVRDVICTARNEGERGM